MFKKVLSILLALCLVFCLFAGCGSSAAPADADTADASSAAVDEAEEPDEEPDVDVDEADADIESDIEEASAEEVPALPEAPTNDFYSEHIGVHDYELPMFEDGFELSIFWVQLGAMGGAEQPLKQDLLFWQRVQENLGLTLNFKQASEAVISEQYNLMVASGDMTDLIYESNCGAMGATSVYNGGYDKAIEDDVYVDLTDIIPEYAPNYYAILQADNNVRKDLTTDTGKLYSIAMIYDQPQGVREGPLVRADYLADTGLDTPVTTADWMECFKAMKSNGVQYPMGVSNGGDIRGGFFGNAFGTSVTHGFKIDLSTNELVYDATSDEIRDFIEFFAEAFKAGYIDPDYAYAQMFDTSLQTSGAVALFGGMDRDLTNFKESYDMDLMAVPMTYPEGSEAPKMYSYEYARQRTSGMKNIVVTTACADPEMAVQFLDWFYSTDGASAVNFGFNEDESYEVVNGVKQMLPFMGERNEDLVNYEVIYALDEGPGFQIVNKKSPITADYVLEAKKIWLDVDTSKALYSGTPTLAFTAEEAEDMTQINSDIYTYVSTEIARFMMGENELTDATWKTYCDAVDAMGLAELQSFYQTAYDRYANR